MENNRKRRLIEWGKNVLIAALALSALYLSGRTQLYGQGDQGLFSSLLSLLPEPEETDAAQTVGQWTQGSVPRPVRMVILSPQGSAGIQYGNAALDPCFHDLINPLADALAGASPPEEASAEEFRAALTANVPGVYLDFLGDLPLPNLAAWLSGGRTSSASLTASARRLLLTIGEGGQALLYYIDAESGLCYVSQTSGDLADRLIRFAEAAAPNGAAFAFESGAAYAVLDPYTLLEGTASPRPGCYSASNPAPIESSGGSGYGEAFDALVRNLSFQPQSASYQSGRDVVVQEGSERLRVSESGLVTYTAPELADPRYPIQGLSQDPEDWELVGSAWAFVETVFQTASTPLYGEARLYATGLEDLEGGGAAVTFGYQLDGAPVYVGTNGWAARVEITGQAITGYQLQLRSYTYLEEGRQVLPELQATAALEAMGLEGSELMLYYYDDLRSGTVSADWGAF